MVERFSEKIKVFSPATVANVGCGFDVFAFALEQPGDEIELSKKKSSGVKIVKLTGSQSLPRDAGKNTAGVAISAMLRYLKVDFGINISLHKKMPIKSGLGSSAASAVGGVYALNQLLGSNLTNELLLKFAIEGEKIASGNKVHLDNTAACLYGGFVLVRSEDPVDIISIPIPENLYCVILHPQIEINTAEARKMLPEKVHLSDATKQWSNTAAVIAALYESDYELLKRAIEDPIIEPARAQNIPGYKELKDIALSAGAVGCGISGSGPAVFALASSESKASKICKDISDYYKSTKVSFETYISKINNTGPRILAG